MNRTRLDLPYVQAAGDGGLRTQTQLIVIHATDNTASAVAEAAYCSHRPDLTSCHVFVDSVGAVQVLPLDHIAFGCFPTGNSRSIQFELCGLSNAVPAAVIARAAGLVAQVCALWDIPAVHLTPAQAVAGQRGIIGHDGVTLAWHEGDHTDPGATFPWGSFISHIQAALGGSQGETMRYTFDASVPGTPADVVGRVHVTDGLTYRLIGKSYQVDNLMTLAGAGPATVVGAAALPAGWDYSRAVAQLCGSPASTSPVPAGSVDLSGLVSAVAALQATVDRLHAAEQASAQAVITAG